MDFNYSRPTLNVVDWENEKTACYQVEVKGICVSRRQDNDMVNCTKLLNLANLSRTRREAILNNEEYRVVNRVGSMALKGVWLPFDKAKYLAETYGLTDILYPLLANDPSTFYHPSLINSTHNSLFIRNPQS
ncbi:hypothetical protein G6F57_009865 [Rhizopus arrhizus]|uniref:HTH APSES-type domain-containing protein n=1 Tax=Rhizopus oryzae TaxID=64495 RepID=A0A9P7BP20_RHIOR|nr:hypothetical protein G6F23_010143 [Rhizopus arrhizus]KAG1402804.1 hypothetical protein G6F58_010497 [Rhizopus delemar]KAG0759158.1 hypothetical protein G6F24_009277 [Rhizopus arrhizus]KAG0791369.1 hypothetical protein G6F21_005140 [Rhizopus arrhizus]KAG0798176.1 hypothetical protein G6F22_004482 [Rhizopus arrhizus]